MPKASTSLYFWYLVARSNGLSDMRWKMSRPPADEQGLPTRVGHDRAIVDGLGLSELDVEDDPQHPRALLDLKQVLVLFLALDRVVLKLDRHQLQRDLDADRVARPRAMPTTRPVDLAGPDWPTLRHNSAPRSRVAPRGPLAAPALLWVARRHDHGRTPRCSGPPAAPITCDDSHNDHRSTRSVQGDPHT